MRAEQAHVLHGDPRVLGTCQEKHTLVPATLQELLRHRGFASDVSHCTVYIVHVHEVLHRHGHHIVGIWRAGEVPDLSLNVGSDVQDLRAQAWVHGL